MGAAGPRDLESGDILPSGSHVKSRNGIVGGKDAMENAIENMQCEYGHREVQYSQEERKYGIWRESRYGREKRAAYVFNLLGGEGEFNENYPPRDSKS